MLDAHFRYAGWLSVDLRVLTTMVVGAGAAAVLLLLLQKKPRRWDEYVVGFLACFALTLGAMWVVTDLVGAPTPLKLETVFPVP